MKQGSMSRKRLVLVLVLTMILTSFSSLAVFADGHEQGLVLLHTNDVHGRLLEGQYDGMGYGKIATHVNEFRAQFDNVLLLDAGDATHGLPIATLTEGESSIRVMNAVGYDVMAPGNHDFNYGADRLMELAEIAEFPVLAANVYKEDGTRLMNAYELFEFEGFTVAVFGLATPETMTKSHPNNTAGLTFTDPLEEAQKVMAELEGMADIVVALVHLGQDAETPLTWQSVTIAEQVDGIDVMVDGHSHTTLEEGMVLGDTLLASAGSYAKNLGVVELVIAEGEVTEVSARLITKEASAETPEQQEIMDLIAVYDAMGQEALAEVAGETTVELVGVRELVRAGETNLGNLLTDAMLDLSGADIAFSNGGGIRASVPAGTITRGNIVEVFPFGNLIEVKEVTGAMMKEILEHGTDAYPEPAGKFPHVGGMTYQIDLSRPVGDRIVNMMIDGEPMDMEATYELATNDFVAAGGDGYDMLGDLPYVKSMSALDEALFMYIQEMGVISPQVEGRITVVGEMPEMEEEPEEMEPMPMPEMPEMPAMEYGVHVVQSGEVLWRIAQQHKTTWEFLAELNQLANPNLIFPGQEIMYPAH